MFDSKFDKLYKRIISQSKLINQSVPYRNAPMYISKVWSNQKNKAYQKVFDITNDGIQNLAGAFTEDEGVKSLKRDWELPFKKSMQNSFSKRLRISVNNIKDKEALNQLSSLLQDIKDNLPKK